MKPEDTVREALIRAQEHFDPKRRTFDALDALIAQRDALREALKKILVKRAIDVGGDNYIYVAEYDAVEIATEALAMGEKK